ncbi:hypothetical protein IQ07DRAFT_403892 [Pyrenochaeta sp. DS3sAY3a]|nr:hypothetical protein IQ07DRAFT_403892 [Pyrenochaeta sp. DS3sAY3a]
MGRRRTPHGAHWAGRQSQRRQRTALPGSRLHSLVVAGAVNCLQSHRRPRARMPTRHVRGGHEQAAPPAASLRLPAYRTACSTHRAAVPLQQLSVCRACAWPCTLAGAANEASCSLAHNQHTLPLVHASRLLPNSLNLPSTRDCHLAASTRSGAVSRPRSTEGPPPSPQAAVDLHHPHLLIIHRVQPLPLWRMYILQPSHPTCVSTQDCPLIG